jgi:hypothetical protein
MGKGYKRPRDVSGESCRTVTNTLVPYILSLIYAVPRVYRLSPTQSCHIYRFSCIRCLVTTVCHQHTRFVSCVSYVWCLVSTVYPQHTRVLLSVSGSKSSNQFQSVATDCDQYTKSFNIASPPDSNGASLLKVCKHPHYLIRLIGFELLVIISLLRLSRDGIEIIPCIKRFLEWIETPSLGGKLCSTKKYKILRIPTRIRFILHALLGMSLINYFIILGWSSLSSEHKWITVY